MPAPLLAKYRDRRRNDSTADIVDAQKIGTDLNWAEDRFCILVAVPAPNGWPVSQCLNGLHQEADAQGEVARFGHRIP